MLSPRKNSSTANTHLYSLHINYQISIKILWFYSYPKFVYKKLFERTYLSYYKETIMYFIVFIIICSITYVISSIINIDILLLTVIIRILICIIVPNLLMIIIYRNNKNYKYIIGLIKNFLQIITSHLKRIKLL